MNPFFALLSRVVACACFLSSLAQPQSETPTLVFRGGRIFDAERAQSRPCGQLWVRGDRILGERDADAVIPEGAKVVDATGKTLLPGLFDLHVHIAVAGGPMSTFSVTVTPQDNLRSQAYCGVTHVLDLHGDQETIFALRQESRTDVNMARLYAVGGAFTRPNGHATQFGVPANTVDTPEEVKGRMQALLPRQPDAIKGVIEHGQWGGLPAFPTFDDPLAKALAAESKAAQLPLFMHVWSAKEALLAAQVGASALAHGVFLGKVNEELVAAMLESGTAYVPTLSVVLASVHAIAEEGPYDHELVRECIHPDVVAALEDDGLAGSLMASPMSRLGRRQEPIYGKNLLTLHEAGVSVGMGTDAGNPLTLHGPALLFEMERYVAAGLTPAQALQAATFNSARILRVDEDFGCLAAGKVADVILVDGDPTVSIEAMWQVAAVYKAGQAVDRQGQKERMAKLNKAAETWVAEEELIDDFSDGDLVSALGGTWTLSSDGIAGGKSVGELAVVEESGASVLRLRGDIKPGFAWGPWVGAAVQWDASGKVLVDASAYRGVRVEMRATKRSYTMTCHRAAVKDFNYWTQSFAATGDWQVAELSFEDFAQIGFGQAVPWSADDIKGIQIDARNGMAGGAMGEFSLEIRSVEWY